METEQKPQKKWYKKIKYWIFISLGVFIGIIILALISGMGIPILKDVPKEVKQANLNLNGWGVEANSTVKAYLNGDMTMETQADNEGKFNIELNLNEGKNTVYTIATYKGKLKKGVEEIITYINKEKIDAQNKAEADAREAEQEAQQKADEEAKLAAQQKADEEARIAQEAQDRADEEVKQKAQDEQDAKAKIDADNEKIALAEEQRKAQEAAQAAKDEQIALANEEKDFKASCKSISYKLLEKDSLSHLGENVVYKGKIDQAGTDLGFDWFRISVTPLGYGIYTDTIWVIYSGSTEFVKDDVVRFWGFVGSPYCYKSQAGWDICIPSVSARYISK